MPEHCIYNNFGNLDVIGHHKLIGAGKYGLVEEGIAMLEEACHCEGRI